MTFTIENRIEAVGNEILTNPLSPNATKEVANIITFFGKTWFTLNKMGNQKVLWKLLTPRGCLFRHCCAEGVKAQMKADLKMGKKSVLGPLPKPDVTNHQIIQCVIKGQELSVVMSAVLDYLIAEILEAASQYTSRDGKPTITTDFVKRGINGDEELECLKYDNLIKTVGAKFDLGWEELHQQIDEYFN